jgi:hypothetical protein
MTDEKAVRTALQTTLSGCRWARGPLTAAAMLLIAVGAAQAEGPPEPLAYDADTGHVSATIEAMPADELLRAIGDVASIRVRTRGDVGTVRAQSFEGLPLDEAIRRVFRSPDRALLMLYEVTPDGGQRLAEVRLSPRTVTSGPPAPRPQVEKLPQLAAAPAIEIRPPPLIHLRLPPPPPPPRRR